MKHCFTIDMENWYDIELAEGINTKKIDQIEESVSLIEKKLDKHKTRATFFVLTSVAEKHPELIKKLHDKGHEIASHGSSHKMIRNMSEEEFELDIGKSVKTIRKITGTRPIGYRAPTFSIDNRTKWALAALERNGFSYDSSIFPIKTFLYGVDNAPLEPYMPDKSDLSKKGKDGILELSPATVKILGKRVPIAGGFYMRLLPWLVIKSGMKKIEREGRPAVMYIHPWETYEKTPKMRLGLKSSFITYYGCKHMMTKIEKLLNDSKFSTMESIL